MIPVQTQPPVPPDMPDMPMPDSPDMSTPDDVTVPMDDSSPGQVDPNVAGYRTPDLGPFECHNCVFFQEPNACQIVSGEIDPKGTCNMHTSAHNGAPQDMQDTSEGEMPAEEMPIPPEEEAPVPPMPPTGA